MSFKNKIRYKLIRGFLKFKNNLKSKLAKVENLSENQIIVVNIIKKLLSNPDTELLVTTISRQYYLRHKDIFVIIEANTVKLINGKYHYNLTLPDKVASDLVLLYGVKLEKKRQKMEREILTKTNISLKKILDEVHSNL